MIHASKLLFAGALVLLVTQTAAVQAADVKFFAGGGFKAAAEALAPGFEQAGGHKLAFTFDSEGGFAKRIKAGESFDVLLIGPGLVDPLIKDGNIVAATRADVARAGLGLAVKAGAPKPDISSVDNFKRALLAAKSVAFVGDGHSGEYFRGMIDHMGIADQMKSKLKPLGTSNLTKAVASGEADFAVWVIPGLLADRGVDVAGPIPTELQDYVALTAGLSTAAKEAEPGKALVKYLTSDAAKATMKSKGWQPAPY